MLWKKQEDTESTSWAVLPGTSGACWMLMVVSLGGRKLKPRPSPMLLGHHVLHWWAMKKYKRGQMSAMTANLLSFESWRKRHQFLQKHCHSLNFESWKKGLETVEVLKISRSMQIQTTIPLIPFAQSSQQLFVGQQKQIDWQVTLSWQCDLKLRNLRNDAFSFFEIEAGIPKTIPFALCL